MSIEKRYKLAAENRRARHDYLILETLEAGLILQGSEVKSLRAGRASIIESHAAEKAGEIYLFNATIQEYASAQIDKHEPKRPRKLLLKKREINRLVGSITRKGMTVVPLSIYFNEKGYAKISLGLAKGKKLFDKRQAEKERDWKREKEQTLKNKNH
ncbi:MAG: SsrA-binding protein SmpB [Janthinobacterium lividum]